MGLGVPIGVISHDFSDVSSRLGGWRQRMSFFNSAVALINALAAIIQAAFLVVSIFYLNRQFGIIRGCSYIERFNSPDTTPRRGAVDGWLKSSESEQDR